MLRILQLAIKTRDDFSRRKCRSVMEAHIVTQREAPREAIARYRPPRRERRLDVGGSLLPCDERVENLSRDERRGSAERRRWIESGRNSDDTDTDFPPWWGGLSRKSGRRGGKKSPRRRPARERDARHAYVLIRGTRGRRQRFARREWR